MEKLHRYICETTNATSCKKTEVLQELWSGYGEIARYRLQGTSLQQIIVKNVKPSKLSFHPRGWDTDLSHRRKVQSYQIESHWYNNYANKTNAACRIPKCYGVGSIDEETVMLLEDLDDAGFPLRKTSINWIEMQQCIVWLANFHALFLNTKPENLWSVGTFWHLETRPDELVALNDKTLKKAAGKIDTMLNSSPFQTIVHGDAKLANFCFAPNGEVAAVDFQYVGGGCGMKDLAYFVGSCLYEDDCERYETEILDTYFVYFRQAITKNNITVNVAALEDNWRTLYPVAWTDFHRFLKGWSPGHWKINSYSERIAQQVIQQLNL